MNIEKLFLCEADEGGGFGGGADGAGAGGETQFERESTAPDGAAALPNSTSAPAPGWVRADGSWEEGVFDRLPEDLRGAKATVGKYKSLPELIKGHMNLQQRLGKAATAAFVPDERSTPEEVAAFRRALGVPQTADAYKLRPETLPEGIDWRDENAKTYMEIAHRHGIPEAAMKDLAAETLRQRQADVASEGEAFVAQREEGLRALRTTFKDGYEKKMNLATRAAQMAGLDIHSQGLADPQVVVALSRLGEMLSEDKLVTAGGGGRGSLTGKALAADIQTNPQNPRYERYQDGDPSTVDYVRGLLRNG